MRTPETMGLWEISWNIGGTCLTPSSDGAILTQPAPQRAERGARQPGGRDSRGDRQWDRSE